ncbi:unnamed protein product [Dibothriocephalus latus]|uniref:Uncharacterized protein n=1 Tax=Dibothriocephalus latus TaxID=60516 RepID=A0A3P7MXD5_DIBLA|nr:unnamed protein product [Dibothriocephalus latus]
MLESAGASLDLRDMAISRCSDIASPAPKDGTGEMSPPSQKVRASAPPPTTLHRSKSTPFARTCTVGFVTPTLP